jgi:hypothetical protein
MASLAFSILAGSIALAQEPSTLPPPSIPVKPVQTMHDLEKTLPLPPSGQSKLEVELLPEASISADDKQLIASAAHEIRRRTAIDSIDVGNSNWAVQQIACSAFPRSLVLRYTVGKSPRDRSEFIASIARTGHEVRLIPIERKGYSIYSPLPANAMTVGAINTMIAREDSNAAISQIALCYAALIGAAPEVSPDGKSVVRLEVPPAIQAATTGDETVLFTTGGIPRQSWTLEFNQQGKLLKAEQVTHDAIKVKKVPPPRQLHGVPIPSTPLPEGQPEPAAQPK